MLQRGSLLVFVMARLEERTQNLIREFLPQMPCLAWPSSSLYAFLKARSWPIDAALNRLKTVHEAIQRPYHSNKLSHIYFLVSKISTAVFSTVRTHSTECNDVTQCLAIRSKAASLPSAGLLDVVLAYCKEELRIWVVMVVQNRYQLREECSTLCPAKPLHRTCSGCKWPCHDGFKDSL